MRKCVICGEETDFQVYDKVTGKKVPSKICPMCKIKKMGFM